MTITASTVADSVSPDGHRLTTLLLRYPRFIHAEFLTHRMFSRNSSSSRAIPTAKLIEEVRSDARAAPVFWGKNQAGMQAAGELPDDDYVSGVSSRGYAKEIWNEAALDAARQAERLLEIGAHKQIVNRLLEPFLHINTLVSATEWANFDGLRLHKDAQPEMQALARAIWYARKSSTPVVLKPGQWHLPFITTQFMGGGEIVYEVGGPPILDSRVDLATAQKVSVARCARLSYMSFTTGKRSTIGEDLALYDRLVGAHPMHASPAEHVATPDRIDASGEYGDYGAWGNFVGWRMFRKMLPGEYCAPLPEGYV